MDWTPRSAVERLLTLQARQLYAQRNLNRPGKRLTRDERAARELAADSAKQELELFLAELGVDPAHGYSELF